MDFTISKYLYETISGGRPNQLPISSVCNARCIFCSNKMNPFPILREGFRPLEDVKRGIALLSPSPSAEIRLGDSLPGRISEGEALLHPELIDILKLIRDKFPTHRIQFNTNGTMLTDGFIQQLLPYSPLRFTISYHSDNKDNWCQIFRLGGKKYEIARQSFFSLMKNGIPVEGAIVPLPQLVGNVDIEGTVRYMSMFTKHILVYPPGYTSKASVGLRRILKVDMIELSSFLMNLGKKYGVYIDLKMDPLKALDFSPFSLMVKSFMKKHRSVLWLLSEVAFERGLGILTEYNRSVPNEHYGGAVKNHTYRGNITCAGLLMVRDFEKAARKALKDLSKKGVDIDLIILPKIAFDKFGCDLQGVSYEELTGIFQTPVWIC
jgi:hypothetical protein